MVEVGQIGSMCDRCRPNFAKFGPILTKFFRVGARCGPNWPIFARIGPNSAKFAHAPLVKAGNPGELPLVQLPCRPACEVGRPCLCPTAAAGEPRNKSCRACSRLPLLLVRKGARERRHLMLHETFARSGEAAPSGAGLAAQFPPTLAVQPTRSPHIGLAPAQAIARPRESSMWASARRRATGPRRGAQPRVHAKFAQHAA